MNRNTSAALPLTASLSLTLAVCDSGGGTAQSPAPAASTSPAVSGALSSGVEDSALMVGMEYAYASHNQTQMDDSNGAIPISNVPGAYASGYDMMIVQRIYGANGWELEVAPTARDSLTLTLQSGTTDVAIAGQSITANRVVQIDMVSPYHYASIVCLTIAGSTYAIAQDIVGLAGDRCTAQSGTIRYDACLPQVPDAQIQTVAGTTPTTVMQLQTGIADFVCANLPTVTAAVVNDSDLIMFNFADTEGDSQLVPEAEWTENVNIGISVTKGSAGLLDAINAVLDGVAADDSNTLMGQAIATRPEM